MVKKGSILVMAKFEIFFVNYKTDNISLANLKKVKEHIKHKNKLKILLGLSKFVELINKLETFWLTYIEKLFV